MSWVQTRRHFTRAFGLGLALMGIGSSLSPARAAETITVLNWQGYGTDEAWALKAFTAKTGIEVKHDYFNSEEEMLTKLRTNRGAYDVVLINSARTTQAAGEDLLDPIDLSKLANAAALSPALRDSPNFKMGDATYGVSWLWGINSLAVRDGIGGITDTLAALSDPAFANRVAMFDDAVTAIGVGALLTGQDINNPTDMKAVADKLRAMKPNVKLLWSSEDQWNKSFAAGEFDLSIYWSGAIARSRNVHKLPVSFVIPKEGAIGWLDGLSLPKGGTKQAAALAFIDYMIDPQFYHKWATEFGAPASANQAAMEGLPAGSLNRVLHNPSYLAKLQFMGPLPDARRQAFLDLWEETKAFYAK